MRHRQGRVRLGRQAAARRSLLVALAQALIRRGRITTTLAKAKAVRPFVERLVSLGREPSLTNRRALIERLRDAQLADRVLRELGPRFVKRPGGYTRILRLGRRSGDRAQLALLEFVA